jgi:hypothetical protein
MGCQLTLMIVIPRAMICGIWTHSPLGWAPGVPRSSLCDPEGVTPTMATTR